VVSFNGHPVTQFEEKVNQYLSADRNNIHYLRRYPEGNSSLMVQSVLFREMGYDQDYVDIVYEKDRAVDKSRVPFWDEKAQPPINFCRNNVTRVREGNHWQVLKDEGAVYLQLNSLPTRYGFQLFDNLFSTAYRDGLQCLILDLRNNRGGWSGWCDEFLRYIVARRTALLVFKGRGPECTRTGWLHRRGADSQNPTFRGTDLCFSGTSDVEFGYILCRRPQRQRARSAGWPTMRK
jgi:hypothetical protein